MIEVIRPGEIPYAHGLAMQLMLRARLYKREEDDPLKGYFLVLEHPRTVTLGRRGELEHLMSPALLAQQGVEVFRIDRGGEATYHEPGQLVAYPILHLKSLELGVVDLIRNMAGQLADAIAPFGLSASYDCDHPGLWTEGGLMRRKVASVGMRVSKGVTTHGVAINLINEMTGFGWIVPCGMPQAPMTRLLDHVEGVDDPREEVFDVVKESFLEKMERYLGEEFVEGEVPEVSEEAIEAARAECQLELSALG